MSIIVTDNYNSMYFNHMFYIQNILGTKAIEYLQ